MERIYIEEATELLGYYDRRSVKRWCHNNGVSMFCDNGSNRLYLILEEFNRAKDRKIHQHLQIPLKAIDSNKNNSQYVQVEKQSYTNGPMEPLHIPVSKQWKGLTVYCYRCNTNVSDICKETGKKLNACPFGDRHAFKVYVHVPNKKNERKTKVLATRNVDEAIKQAIEFAKEVKQGTSVDYVKKDEQKESVQISTGKLKLKDNKIAPALLISALQKDIERINNIGVLKHRVKIRSKDHIKDVERAYKVMQQALMQEGYDLRTLRLDEVTDEMVGVIYSYLEEEKGFGTRTRNKYLSHYTSFIKRHNQAYNLQIQNLFETIEKSEVPPDPEMVTREEFEQLLRSIKPENGIKEYRNGVKPTRNLYHEILLPGIKLAAYTGRRREEIITMKYSDIKFLKDGNGYIQCEDYKVNRIRKLTGSKRKYNYIPLIGQLFDLIKELGYEQYKNTDNYILAPTIKNKRNRTLSDILTRGFSHYYQQLGTGKNKTFKNLRKSYVTSLYDKMGDSAMLITGHSSINTLKKFYLVIKALSKSANEFEMFPDEENRKTELEQIRDNTKIKQVSNEKQNGIGPTI